MFFRVKLVTSSDHSGLSLFYQIVRCAQHRDLQRITFTVNVLEDEEKDEDNEISKRVNLFVLLLAKSKLEWKSFLSSKPTPYHAMVMGTIELENFSRSTQVLSDCLHLWILQKILLLLIYRKELELKKWGRYLWRYLVPGSLQLFEDYVGNWDGIIKTYCIQCPLNLYHWYTWLMSKWLTVISSGISK